MPFSSLFPTKTGGFDGAGAPELLLLKHGRMAEERFAGSASALADAQEIGVEEPALTHCHHYDY